MRDKVKIGASGKVISSYDILRVCALGADWVNMARPFMFSLGCIQAMQCNKNTCPTGVTTHNKRLQAGLDPLDKAHRVNHYANNMMKEVATIAHSCGAKDPRQLTRQHIRIITDNGKSMAFD